MCSDNLARILVWRLHFLFLWNNGARKSHAAQQTLKVRNVLSEVFVDPMPKITLVRSLKINIWRRRKMQAAPKMITYLYKVVYFFPYKETFIPYSEIYIFIYIYIFFIATKWFVSEILFRFCQILSNLVRTFAVHREKGFFEMSVLITYLITSNLE